ncbi:MAG: hypothetical protein M1831_006013 [Alyxoria varia]|nr:MAG: hypothetical protein M1831_006013 [Alyxoria varia]
MSNFDPNAILRGLQLTVVGGNYNDAKRLTPSLRALQNPNLFKHSHYRQAALAVLAGLAIHLILQIPVFLAKSTLWVISFFSNLERATWDDQVVSALHFIQHSVLQVPFFLMNLMKFFSPALDEMFMESLDWVDRTYVAKHASDDPARLRAMYYPNLRQYSSPSARAASRENRKNPWAGLSVFLARYGKKAGLSLTVLLLSYTPYVGKFVIPGLSFYYFNNAVGIQPAAAVFASSLVLPRKYVVRFLQSYFASRSMMRELLDPYFSRLPFSSSQKQKWFQDRSGVLFGFGIGFFFLVKTPLFGVLVYGVAEASTAYLVTKITDPPPPGSSGEKGSPEMEQYVEGQVQWRNKAKFLSLGLGELDRSNVVVGDEQKSQQGDGGGGKVAEELPGKKFT